MSSTSDHGAQKLLYALVPLNADAEAAVLLKQNRHSATFSEDHKPMFLIGLDNVHLGHGLKVTLGSDLENSIVLRGTGVSGKHCIIAVEPSSGELYVEHLHETAGEGVTTTDHGHYLSSGYLSRCTVSAYLHGAVLGVGTCCFMIKIYKARLTNEDIEYLKATYRVKLGTDNIQGKPATNDLGKYDRAHDDMVLAEINSTLSGKTWVQKVDVFLDGRHQTVACKRIPFGGQKDVIMHEVKIMSALEHPNLVPLLHHSISPDSLALYLPWYPHRDLRHWLPATSHNLPLTLSLLRQSLSALTYLHAHGYVHRDIKPDNIFLSSLSPAHFLLADFGLAFPTPQLSTDWAGTSPYVAPEVDSGLVPQAPQTEIWSLALTVGEAIGYWGLEDIAAARKAGSVGVQGYGWFSPLVGMIPGDCPVRELLCYMLRADGPLGRPSAGLAGETLEVLIERLGVGEMVGRAGIERVRPGLVREGPAVGEVPGMGGVPGLGVGTTGMLAMPIAQQLPVQMVPAVPLAPVQGLGPEVRLTKEDLDRIDGL